MGDVIIVAPEPPTSEAPSPAKVVKTLGDEVEVKSLAGGGGGGGVEVVKPRHVLDGGHVGGSAAASAGLPIKVCMILFDLACMIDYVVDDMYHIYHLLGTILVFFPAMIRRWCAHGWFRARE